MTFYHHTFLLHSIHGSSSEWFSRGGDMLNKARKKVVDDHVSLIDRRVYRHGWVISVRRITRPVQMDSRINQGKCRQQQPQPQWQLRARQWTEPTTANNKTVADIRLPLRCCLWWATSSVRPHRPTKSLFGIMITKMTLFTTPDVSNGNVSRRRRRTAEPRPQAISIKILENLVFEICLQRDTQTYVHTDMSIQTRSWQ